MWARGARSLFKRNSYFNFIFTLARRRVRVTRRGMRRETKHPLAPVHAAAPRDIYEPTLCVPAPHLPAVVSKHTPCVSPVRCIINRPRAENESLSAPHLSTQREKGNRIRKQNPSPLHQYRIKHTRTEKRAASIEPLGGKARAIESQAV